jgi:Cupin-like domain
MSTSNRLKAVAMQSRDIPVYELGEFQRLIEASPDLLSSHPCVVRGFTGQWAASRRWTSLESLTEAFGSFPVTAGAPQFITHKHSKMCQVKTDFGTYLKYVQDPDRLEELFEGKWSKGDATVLRELDLPLYCGNLRLVRHSREEVLSEIDPLVPGRMEYLNDDIPYYYQSGNHVWLYVSRAGALTPLHQDNNAVIAYLAQLQGHKEAILYSPEDKRHFWNRDLGYMDPLSPNDDEFPTWREARPWTASLNPGELLIWGPNWAHHVVTLSDSITVSFDIVNSLNLGAYTRSVDWRDELGRIARKNADLFRKRMPHPSVHEALDNAVEADLGREVMICVLRDALATPLAERSRRVKSEMLRILDESI